MQILDYNDILDHLKTNLEAANTTTAAYDLSTGLDRRVQYVLRQDIDIVPQFKPKYPLITFSLENKPEEIPLDISGGAFNKEINLSFKVSCVYDAYSEAEDNLWTLVRNVEANLRYNDAINDYNENGFKFIYILPGIVRPIVHEGGKSFFNKTADITVQIKGHLKDA